VPRDADNSGEANGGKTKKLKGRGKTKTNCRDKKKRCELACALSPALVGRTSWAKLVPKLET
jgi:hypothetical protein